MAFQLKRLDEHTWGTFVRPAVKLKTNPSTRAIIEGIMPYFPKDCHCIAGYLDDADQFWKVNYHWELLLRMMRRALKLDLQVQSRGQLERLIEELLTNPPNPDKGYADSAVVGEPHDKTSAAGIVKRWETMRFCKQEFGFITNFEDIPKKHPPAQPWFLAAAPVARPGTSKHGGGYALDIEGKGKNQLIKQIAGALGATLKFDEKSHVHVEFKQGVVVGGKLVADDAHDGKWAGWKHRGASGP
ncbi:MAG TPA: hypothetical protein VGL09_14860 [Methylomirabilota bacterium]|jgi:hypothetical protein